MQDFMTTKEVATYLRIKERRVYELVRRRAIPCTRVTGKWLFPKALVDLWVKNHLEGAPPPEPTPPEPTPPPVVAGSHDPLLDWAVKESDCGLALLTGGSLDGLERLGAGEAVVAGLHLLDGETGEYNVPAVARTLPSQGVVLIEWAWRTQGLVVAAGNPRGIETLADLKAGAVPVIRRQQAAGSQLLLAHLLEREGLALDELNFVAETARSETDLGLAILEGRAEAGIAVEAVARSLKLGFVPLLRERYDLLLRRRDYFEPPVQKLLTFALSEAFRNRADQMGGYDVTGLGQIRYNGP